MWEGVFVNRGKTKTYLQKRGYNSLYTQILKNNKLDKGNAGPLVFFGGGVFYCYLYSQTQQKENKLSSLILINMQTGADAYSPSTILIFKSSFIYSSAPPPPLFLFLLLQLCLSLRAVCRQHCDRNRCSPLSETCKSHLKKEKKRICLMENSR